MKLVRDLLDERVVDAEGRPLGRVDGLVLEVRGGRPRVAFLEMGGPTLAARLHPRLGRWAAALAARWSPARGRPYRIPWTRVRDVGLDVVVEVAAAETPGGKWERWLGDALVGRIPGA